MKLLNRLLRGALVICTLCLCCACEKGRTKIDVQTEYSDEELSGVKDKITERYKELQREVNDTDSDEYDLLSSIAGYAIDSEKKIVVVEIADLTEKKEEMFWKLFDVQSDFSDYVELQNVDEVNETFATE